MNRPEESVPTYFELSQSAHPAAEPHKRVFARDDSYLPTLFRRAKSFAKMSAAVPRHRFHNIDHSFFPEAVAVSVKLLRNGGCYVR